MSWTLAPALTQLMAEVNAAWPNRDRSTDGTIGDYKHSLTTSEHNPYDEYGKKDPNGVVRAVDIDKDGIHVPTLLNATIGDRRVHYVIYNKIIYSCHYGWRARPYHGEDPHTGHIHISLRNNTSEHIDPAVVLAAQKDTSPWLKGTNMSLTDAEYNRIAADVWAAEFGSNTDTAKSRLGTAATRADLAASWAYAAMLQTAGILRPNDPNADSNGYVSLRQETADSKSLGEENKEAIVAINRKLDSILEILNADAAR